MENNEEIKTQTPKKKKHLKLKIFGGLLAAIVLIFGAMYIYSGLIPGDYTYDGEWDILCIHDVYNGNMTTLSNCGTVVVDGENNKLTVTANNSKYSVSIDYYGTKNGEVKEKSFYPGTGFGQYYTLGYAWDNLGGKYESTDLAMLKYNEGSNNGTDAVCYYLARKGTVITGKDLPTLNNVTLESGYGTEIKNFSLSKKTDASGNVTGFFVSYDYGSITLAGDYDFGKSDNGIYNITLTGVSQAQGDQDSYTVTSTCAIVFPDEEHILLLNHHTEQSNESVTYKGGGNKVYTIKK